ncbi:hypothetical protein [Microcoleus phage My-WqHQDG]|nr:hypothetical protein [Microcoleus phage My-WqHQDG]
MTTPRVSVDFNNADEQGRVYLTCVGTLQDLNQQGIQLVDGLVLLLYQEDLIAEATTKYDDEQRVWVAVVDWDHMRIVHYET